MNRIGWPSVIIEFSGRVSELMPKENYKAVIRFEDFRKKTPEAFQLDALCS
ncbi:hypothetical protein P7H22_01875 [Paenibacillus larvae]|nr:hypothetical protein [Paenibacillus larvae]MDT2239398.1 hypothetical protein [Paenibacillus larvae]